MNLRNTFNEDSFEYTTMNDIIAEGMRQPKRQALYKNLWYENELCVLFGASNCGKSIYAMQIAKHIAQEQPILYFDYELNIQQICDRYTNNEGTSPCKFPQNIFRPNLDFDMAKNFKERRAYLRMRIEEAVTKKGIKLFIIDNITCLHPNLSKANEAATFILELRTFMNSLGASFLLLGHSPKKKDTRKNAQQAPQEVQGETDIYTNSEGFSLRFGFALAIYHHCLYSDSDIFCP